MEKYHPEARANTVAEYFVDQHPVGRSRRHRQNSRGTRRSGRESGRTAVRRAIHCLSWPCRPVDWPSPRSERLAPDVLTRIENLLAEVGLKDEEIIVRMTGCPNGCARPYNAELALVGRAPGKYPALCGRQSGRNTPREFHYKDNVKNDDLVNELRPMLTRFAQELEIGRERFGDFCHRVLLAAAPAAAA